MAHSLEPAPQQPRPRPRNGIRGLAAIARTHPRRAMMDVVSHFSITHATMSVDEDRRHCRRVFIVFSLEYHQLSILIDGSLHIAY